MANKELENQYRTCIDELLERLVNIEQLAMPIRGTQH